MHENEVRNAIALCPSSFAVASIPNISNSTFLTENDIPGASLLGRKPEELTISELNFWHKCCGDAGIREGTFFLGGGGLRPQRGRSSVKVSTKGGGPYPLFQLFKGRVTPFPEFVPSSFW